MRILITGGAGCLGSNLVERYVPQGHEVLALDNFATGKREVLPEVPGLTVVEGSVVDRRLVDDCFESFRPSHVIHAAAAYKDPTDWGEDAATNVGGTINVVNAAERTGTRRLVYFQTALCYGRPDKVPIPVDHPLRPFTSYGISKTAGEQYALMAHIPVISLRLANVIAPRLAIGPLPTFYKRLNAQQKCFCSDTVRDFLDIEDFFDITDRVLADDAPTGAFNISTGAGRSIEELFNVVIECLGITLDTPVAVVPPGDDDIPAVVLDASHTQKSLDWQAKIGFRDAVWRMLRWYDAHGVSDIYSHLAAPRA